MRNSTRSEKQRVGCAGNLIRLVLVFSLVALLLLATEAVFAPWGFYLGGKFHPLPYWQGWGRLHSKTSGDYVVYVFFYPYGGKYDSYLSGTGSICTPHGEKISLTLIGSMRKHLNLSTDGEHIYLKVYNRTRFYNYDPAHHPRLEFLGNWRNPNIVMNDTGNIAHEFRPDGSVWTGSNANRPYGKDVLPITFMPGSYSDFKSACAALHR